MPQTHRLIHSGGRLTVYFGSHETIDDFQRTLLRLNGDDRFSLNLAAFPSPKWPEDLTTADEATMDAQYLQCAGSAEALTVEVRQLVDAVSRLYTLGRPADYIGEPSVEIPFQYGRHTLSVYPAEVFTAADAAAIFFAYYKTQQISDFHLREIDLDAFVAPSFDG